MKDYMLYSDQYKLHRLSECSLYILEHVIKNPHPNTAKRNKTSQAKIKQAAALELLARHKLLLSELNNAINKQK
jgi:hypothetical protein